MCDLNYIQPEEQYFHLHATQVTQPILGDCPRDFLTVLEVVPLYGETARPAKVRCELSGVSVELVALDAGWKNSDREVVFLQDFVRRQAVSDRRSDSQEKG